MQIDAVLRSVMVGGICHAIVNIAVGMRWRRMIGGQPIKLRVFLELGQLDVKDIISLNFYGDLVFDGDLVTLTARPACRY